ncbi:phosphopantetheine adenylyltransferase, partial [Marinobacter profundi]
AIAWSVGGYNESVRKVVIADIIAIVALIAAGVIRVVGRNQI